jgi:hypothetical protein
MVAASDSHSALTTPRSPPARLGLRLALSLLITAGIVVLVGRRVDAVPDDLRVPLWLVPAYLATLLVYFLARAGRWWFLVSPLGAVPPATVLAIACAGFLWILLLPWRLGEFVRPLLLARASAIPFSQALGTVALERVVDGLIVCGMFFAATAMLPRRARDRQPLHGLPRGHRPVRRRPPGPARPRGVAPRRRRSGPS